MIEKDWRTMGEGACYWKELIVYIIRKLKGKFKETTLQMIKKSV